jgi:hypothetical protein
MAKTPSGFPSTSDDKTLNPLTLRIPILPPNGQVVDTNPENKSKAVVVPSGTDNRFRIRKIPSVADTITGAVRYGMALNQATEETARNISMDPVAYRFIRKLLLLADDPTLPLTEKLKIEQALQSIDSTQRLYQARKLTKQIIASHWTERTQGGKTRSQRTKQARQLETLDNVLFRVRELCDSTDELMIPPLEIEARLEAVKSLSSSIAALSAMLQRLTSKEE